MGLQPRWVPLPSTILPAELVVTATHVYWLRQEPEGHGEDQKSFISRCKLDGSEVEEGWLDLGPHYQIRALAVDDAHIYWSASEQPDLELPVFHSVIGRAKLDRSVVETNLIAVKEGHPEHGLAVNATHIYWSSQVTSTIGRANIDGSEPDPNWLSVLPVRPGSLVLSATHLYWTVAAGAAHTDPDIGRVGLDGSEIEASFINPRKAGEEDKVFGDSLAIDSEHIYWLNSLTGHIVRATLDGVRIEREWLRLPTPEGDRPEYIARDARHTYWAHLGAIGRTGGAPGSIAAGETRTGLVRPGRMLSRGGD